MLKMLGLCVFSALLLVCIITQTAGWPVNLRGGPLNFITTHRGLQAVEAEPVQGVTRRRALPDGYLYPVLAWGPNNQLAGLKEALVLGQMLNRTVILHDILNHYDDLPSSPDGRSQQPFSMDFSLVFNLDLLARYRSVTTLAELRAAGWDSRLEAVAHFGPKFLPQMKTARALNVTDDDATYIDFQSFECTSRQLASMAAALAPYRHVAFILYENVVRDAGHGVKLRVTGEMCHDEYLQVSGQLVKSDRLIQLAGAFRRKRLGGEAAGFMAVHIRPYPDKCLYVWRRPEYNDHMAASLCKNPNLFHVFAQQTLNAMTKHDLKNLFVMSYPELRPRISEMYGAVGLAPVFYDEADLEAAVGYRSISLLGMVEEEIAFEADVFIGTSYSSMTGIIMQERFARAKRKDSTDVFTKTG